jgi:hypothetical protein
VPSKFDYVFDSMNRPTEIAMEDIVGFNIDTKHYSIEYR